MTSMSFGYIAEKNESYDINVIWIRAEHYGATWKVGKTTLAKQYIAEKNESYDINVIWIRAEYICIWSTALLIMSIIFDKYY